MDFDAKKFIDEEGLALNHFGDWLHENGEEVKDKPGHHSTIVPKDRAIVLRFLEGVQGAEKAKEIMEEIDADKVRVESIGKIITVVNTPHGEIRIPSPMIRLKDVDENDN